MSFFTTNYSLYAIPLAFMFTLGTSPRFLLQSAGLETPYAPRADIARIEAIVASGKPLYLPKQNKTLTGTDAQDFIDLYYRQRDTHENAWENLPLFYTAILAGNFAKLDASLLNGAAVAYILSRLVFGWAYTNSSSKRPGLSALRITGFWAGTLTSFALIIKSGLSL